MACGPRCFRWKSDIPSGPAELLCFVLRMASTVMTSVDGGVMFLYMESDFELARQGLNEFVHLGHKGLSLLIIYYLRCYY